jgi:hypothetical protein
MLAVVLFVVAALFLVELVAAGYTFAYYAGRLSLVLFLGGSVWCFGFLLLRTANQAATESYDLQRAELEALHGDEGKVGVEEVLRRYGTLSRSHWEIARTRAHSAALTLYGTVCAGVAGLCVFAGFPGEFWALFDFLAVLLFTAAILLHVMGPGRPGLTHHVDRFLPPRWQQNP